ncbi:MAG TPA: hypothetical protein VF861_10560 [Telluria sp.]
MKDEICFLFYPNRAAKHLQSAVGLTQPDGVVLQSDCYIAYEHYAKKPGCLFPSIEEQFNKEASCRAGASLVRWHISAGAALAYPAISMTRRC